jgi:cardiolipin synthase
MLTVPNIITITRVLLIPVMVYLIMERHYEGAFYVFLISAVSDMLDGFIARHFHQMSQFGAVLDPVADKLTMLTLTVLLASQGVMPEWLAIAIVARDVVIVSGAVTYRFVVGPMEMQPTLLSKLNTLLEFFVIAVVLAEAARMMPAYPWLGQLFMVVFVTVVASGLQYVWLWSRKAMRSGHRES